MSNSQKVKAAREQRFEAIIKGLNDAQRHAVENIEGPMLAIAGPGTGKTHMLAARIGKILQVPDIEAQNVLCLTFTNAGTTAMRERLLKFIGPEAHKINIHTFHSFCDSIIQYHPERFGRQDMEPIDDLERIAMIQKILNGLPYEHLLIKGYQNPFENLGRLKSLFNIIKSERWELKDFITKIKKAIADIPLNEDFLFKRDSKNGKKGEPNPRLVKPAIEKYTKLLAAAQLYPQFKDALLAANRYEFPDMINWVVDAFDADPDFLAEYQEQYQYILVDEYQDTNGSQHKLLDLLTNFWDEPNLFVVGDDDQSIYEFQGARLKNIINFYEKHQSVIKLAVLSQNYRSSQAILDSSSEFIQKNPNRLEQDIEQIDKTLTAGNASVADFKPGPVLMKFANPAQESIYIVQQIEDLMKQGVDLSEVAIIYRKHKQAEFLIDLMLKRKVPFTTTRPENILESKLVNQILDLLSYLDFEFRNPNSGDFLLFKIMHYPFWKIDRRDIEKILMHRSRTKRKEEDEDSRALITLRSIFLLPEEELRAIGVENPAAIKNLEAQMAKLLTAIPNTTFFQLFERVISDTKWVNQLITADDGLYQIQIIQTFKQFLQKEVRNKSDYSIKDLLTTIDAMQENYLRLNINRYTSEGQKVQLMTAHGSKGLEFEHVYFIDNSKASWKSYSHLFNFSFPPEITFAGKTDSEDAERRLFYVSMTRAKRHLTISYPGQNWDEKDNSPNKFLSELMEIQGVEDIEIHEVEDNVVKEYLAAAQTRAATPTIQALPKEKVDTLLRGFRMTASSLSSFMRCPLSFFYERIIRVPSISSPQASYGTAIHRALEKMYEPVKSQKPLLSLDGILEVFEYEMNKQKGYFQPEIYDQRLEMGRENLRRFYEVNKDIVPPEILLELPIYRDEVDGVPIGGELDRVDVYGKEVEIYDYKTGNARRDSIAPPNEKNEHGGPYWRQLHFYKLLYKARYSQHTIRKTGIKYISYDKKKEELPEKIVELLPSDTDLVRGWIKDSYERIMAHDFYTGCEDEKCTWCGFAKDNNLNIDFIDSEDELMESSLYDEDPAGENEDASDGGTFDEEGQGTLNF